MSEMIKTKTFELAVYKKGNDSAEKLALLLPGKLDTKDYPHMRGHVDFLAEKGFLAVAFDPPGTWESNGDISEYCMTNYVKAINELIEYFGNKPTVLIGHSRGGSTAMLAGSRNGEVIAFAAIMSHVAPIPMSKENKEKRFHLSKRDDPKGGEREFKLTTKYYEDPLQYDLLEEIANCEKPKLFVLGNQDVLVTPEEVRAMFEKASKPKKLVAVDYHHDYRKSPEMIEKVNEILDEFLKEIL